ncbi:MAG: tRNA (cytidine(34)-2'-O)-methyltransferase [Pseudomonadota bacterium]
MTNSIHVTLFQPDIAGNTGTILRTAACLGFHVHIIEPAGFDASDRNLKRAGMDYTELATLNRHRDWSNFLNWSRNNNKRLILLTTKSVEDYSTFKYSGDDVLIFGRESAGAPEYVHDAAHQRLTIPMQEGARSLNLAVSVGIVAAHAASHLGG